MCKIEPWQFSFLGGSGILILDSQLPGILILGRLPQHLQQSVSFYYEPDVTPCPCPLTSYLEEWNYDIFWEICIPSINKIVRFYQILSHRESSVPVSRIYVCENVMYGPSWVTNLFIICAVFSVRNVSRKLRKKCNLTLAVSPPWDLPMWHALIWTLESLTHWHIEIIVYSTVTCKLLHMTENSMLTWILFLRV